MSKLASMEFGQYKVFINLVIRRTLAYLRLLFILETFITSCDRLLTEYSTYFSCISNPLSQSFKLYIYSCCDRSHMAHLLFEVIDHPGQL